MTSVDFPRLIGDIQYLLGEEDPATHVRTPIGTPALSRYLGVSRGAVRNWLDGTVPNWDDGHMLVARWCSLTGKAQEFVPLVKRSLSAARMA